MYEAIISEVRECFPNLSDVFLGSEGLENHLHSTLDQLGQDIEPYNDLELSVILYRAVQQTMNSFNGITGVPFYLWSTVLSDTILDFLAEDSRWKFSVPVVDGLNETEKILAELNRLQILNDFTKGKYANEIISFAGEKVNSMNSLFGTIYNNNGKFLSRLEAQYCYRKQRAKATEIFVNLLRSASGEDTSLDEYQEKIEEAESVNSWGKLFNMSELHKIVPVDFLNGCRRFEASALYKVPSDKYKDLYKTIQQKTLYGKFLNSLSEFDYSASECYITNDFGFGFAVSEDGWLHSMFLDRYLYDENRLHIIAECFKRVVSGTAYKYIAIQTKEDDFLCDFLNSLGFVYLARTGSMNADFRVRFGEDYAERFVETFGTPYYMLFVGEKADIDTSDEIQIDSYAHIRRDMDAFIKATDAVSVAEVANSEPAEQKEVS